MGVSIREYARLTGRSHTAVQKAIATGRITREPDGTIDPARANREWEQNTVGHAPVKSIRRQPAAAQPAPEPSQGADPVTAYLKARAVRESFAARTAQLEYEERSGKLIPATRASEYAATFSAIVKDALLALPDRLSPMLAAVDEEKAIHRMLTAEVTAVLKKVNKAVADSGL